MFTVQDNMMLLDVSSIKKVLAKNSEQLFFSCAVQKFNRKDVRQDRVLMLTDKALYNIKKTSIKRRIDLNEIKGITNSTCGTEFVLHVPSEYDYRYSSAMHRDRVIAFLRKFCGCLAIFSKDDVFLKMYTTTRIDKSKNISRMPVETLKAHEAIQNLVQMRQNMLGQDYTKEELQKNTKPLYMNMRDSSALFFSNNNNNNNNNNTESSTMFNFRQSSTLRTNATTTTLAPRIITLDDFDIIKVLGRGTFGKVMMVQKKDSGIYYALKSIRKEKIKDEKLAEHLRMERQVLEIINHPFLVKLKYTFQTNDKLFFIMDFIKGGELFQHLKNHRKFEENIAQFFAAEVLLALEYLHAQKIVYRDLKPENVLLDENGHVCITDFGMAKQFIIPTTAVLDSNNNNTPSSSSSSSPISTKETQQSSTESDHMIEFASKQLSQNNNASKANLLTTTTMMKQIPLNNRERSNSFVGTPQYLSPEIIARTGHTYSTDLWQLGLLVYEMIVGYPPFFHEDTQVVLKLITEARVFFPSNVKISQEGFDFIRCLLQKDPEKRISIQEAKNHAWFKNINWEQLLQKAVPSPFVPPTKGDAWINGFDCDFTSEPPVNSVTGSLQSNNNNMLQPNINFNDFNNFCHDEEEHQEELDFYQKQAELHYQQTHNLQSRN